MSGHRTSQAGTGGLSGRSHLAVPAIGRRGLGMGALALAVGFMVAPGALAYRPEGFDVSHWQGEITPAEWQQAYNAGYVFCFTKATQGTYYTDTEFFDNMDEGSEAGLLMGCYHFADPQYCAAVDEADYFVSVAGPYLSSGYLRPVLDLEWGYSLGATALSNWVNSFMDRVEQQSGVEPLIYTNTNYATYYLNWTVAHRDVWIAQWYPSNPQTDEPDIGVFNAWAFWQWTDSCSIPGIGSSVDCDVFNGTMAELQDFVIGGASQPPTITQHPSDQTVALGDTAQFTVAATGQGTLTYQWQKNGSNLSDGGHYSGVTTTILTISHAGISDAASYRCVVSNEAGDTPSNSATLTVTGQPGDFDDDDDVDQEDFGHFQTCLTGPASGPPPPGCEDANLDGDNDVDNDDFSIFHACMSGANVPGDPNCAQ